jgi:hypothetical protein
MSNSTFMWGFKTDRFTVRWDIWPDDNVDTSFDETGETQRNIDSGKWQAFTSRVSVFLDGVEIAADYLGESIYENPADFRDHIGSQGKHGSYFTDMVRTAIADARTYLEGVPTMRAITE